MVGLPFDFKYQGSARKLTYGTGTPMGAYTSWATFAVAHHFIMYVASTSLGQGWKKSKYCLLGDDILIGDTALAEKYREILLSLDVPFSPIKTHDSKFLSEFAKRLFYKGREITPFPIHAVQASSKFYQLLPVFYGELKKGWAFGEEVAKVVSSYYQFVKGFNANYCKEIYHKAAVAERLMLYIKGTGKAMDCLKAVYRQLGEPLPRYLREALAIAAIQLGLIDQFRESDPSTSSSRRGKPLGLLAEEMVLKLTSHENDDIVA